MSELFCDIKPRLDPHFKPAAITNRLYRERVAAAGSLDRSRLLIAIERENGLVGRHDLEVVGESDAETHRYVERHLKFLLWSQGGCHVFLHGPKGLTERLVVAYSPGGDRAFDAETMERAYGRPLQISVVESADAMPEARQSEQSIGGHLDGCRIGFDLGASDYKLAAVQDGEPVFSTEIPWDPVPQTDPNYHYDKIVEGLKLAASKLPRVDAIGGSSAGIYVNNEVRVASLFRSVPLNQFASEVKPMFHRIQREWDVPLVVVNDGDVTALAGAMSKDCTNLLGIAMGSSEAVGFIDRQGCITGYLNELAFAPVDFNEAAVPDEWSGDRGVGALYFSQQAVNKLAPAAGFSFPEDMGLPERLKQVQAAANDGNQKALNIYDTIGVYLGYSLAHYHDYYGFDHVLLLGRVTSGRGGEVILDRGRQTLETVFPEIAGNIEISVPDERMRRVGQAVAAASLPEIG